jgi:hypothetical protein
MSTWQDLQRVADAADQRLADATENLEAALAAGRTVKETLERDLAARTTERDQARSELTRVQAAYDAYRTAHPDTPPPTPTPPAPVAARTLFGACQETGNTGAAAVGKWGTRIASRRFLTSAPWPATVAPHPDAVVDHLSFSMSAAYATTFPTDTAAHAAVTAMVRSIPPADRPRVILEAIHEGDEKVNRGAAAGYSVPQVIAAKNRFADLVWAVDRNIKVAATYTGWLFDPDNPKHPDEWGTVKADVLGVDFDGIHATKVNADGTVAYPDYADEGARIRAFLTKWGGASGHYRWWAVPEFGTSRDGKLALGADRDGTQRAAWIKAGADRFASTSFAGSPALYVAWYDYESTPGNVIVPGTPEFATWKAVIDLTR